MIAHRGYAGVAPENTLPAFEAVADGRHPAPMIEFDVMPTRDGDVVVFHDLRLDNRGLSVNRGITNATGVIWETSTETIKQARVLGSDAGIPLLEEVVDAVPPAIGLNVELRNPGTYEMRFGEAVGADVVARQRTHWDPFVAEVLDVLDGADHDLLFSSFSESAIAAVRDIAPEFPVGVNVHDSIDDGLEILDRYEGEYIHPRLNMIKGTPFFESPYGSVQDPDFGDIDLVSEAHDRDAGVNVWTVTTWHQASLLQSAGVDGLIADYPGLDRFNMNDSIE